MIVIRPATLEDAIWLSSRLRSEDAREVQTGTGRSPEEVVPLSFQLSDECYTVRRVVDGKVAVDPVAIFGACADPSRPSQGIVWFLGTQDVRLCALSLMTESARWLDHMSRRFSEGLYNYADSRNTLHMRWCLLTGFTVDDPIEIHGVPFHPIHRKQCVTQQRPSL